MSWTSEIIERIQPLFPKQRGNMMIDYLPFFQALQYIAENGCKWRALPKYFGNWNSIYYRFRYWAAAGIFDRIEKELMSQVISAKGVKTPVLDSTYVKGHLNVPVHPKNELQFLGKSRGGWTTKIHSIVAEEILPIMHHLSLGSAVDEPEGQMLMKQVPSEMGKRKPPLTDKAYKGNACKSDLKRTYHAKLQTHSPQRQSTSASKPASC